MPIFLDFEASGLGPSSYPLEVAWGDTATGEIESHLIDPSSVPEWSEAIDPVAGQMHGLSREYLAEYGEHPDRVARRMNEALAGRTAYATSDYDQMWLGELFADPNWGPDFRLVDVAPLWYGLLAGGPVERIEQADAEAWKRLRAEGWRPHRAANDVRHLMVMYQILALGY